ncbi:MAG TPA: DUF2007 domain-containing protein [Planctomycetia bacterium]|nr:DUF2007 domain-containing protein [Planctomycetia bacterium]
MSEEPDLQLVEAYRAGSGAVAHLLVAALEAEGIAAFVDGDPIQGSAGEIPLGWPTAPRIMVREEDLARATAVIAASDLHSGDEDELPEPASKCLSCGATMPEDSATCPKCGWTYAPDPAQSRG